MERINKDCCCEGCYKLGKKEGIKIASNNIHDELFLLVKFRVLLDEEFYVISKDALEKYLQKLKERCKE